MTELYLLRHAHAGNPEKWRGDDDARPLSDKGRSQAERLGRFLAGVGFKPDRFISSPKLRALQTAEIAAKLVGSDVTTDDRLAVGFGLGVLETMLSELDGDRVVFVGHDPDFSEIVATLIGTEAVPVRKGAFLRIDAELPLRPDGALLRWLVPPDLLVTG